MGQRFAALACAGALALMQPAVAVAQAPTWSSEQQGVWGVINRSWSDEVARNGRWPGQYVHQNVVGWGPEWPMPRYRDSMERWSRWFDTQSRVLQHEISPAAITIAGNTAVVHYTAVAMRQREVPRGENPPEPKREAYGIVETLVRDGADWRFLSSSSFPLKAGGGN
ncbi:MAG TPA: hypothetical protein VGD19_08205 [Allosphingosinicella sp.]|jgi:hypothetical protein